MYSTSRRTCGYLFQFSQFAFKTKTKSPSVRARHVQRLALAGRKLCPTTTTTTRKASTWQSVEAQLLGERAGGVGVWGRNVKRFWV